jgi:hypothetical protein
MYILYNMIYSGFVTTITSTSTASSDYYSSS